MSRSERTGLPGTVEAGRDYRRVTVAYRLATGLTAGPERHLTGGPECHRGRQNDGEPDQDGRENRRHPE